MIDEKEVEQIITKTLDIEKKKKVGKTFQDPIKARNAFEWCMIIAFLGMMLSFVAGGIVMSYSISERVPEPEMPDSVLSILDCEDLKKLFSNELNGIQKRQIEQYAVINCI